MFKKMILFGLWTALLFVGPNRAQAAVFSIDPGSSQVLFRIQEFSEWTTGAFTDFSGTLQLDDANVQLNGVTADIDLASVNTRQTQRDEDLRGEDFFNTATAPTARFVSKNITGNKLSGDLTFRGITRSVTLDFQLTPVSNDASGRRTVKLSGKGIVQLHDYGIAYNRTFEKGQKLLSDGVEITVDVTAVMQ